MLDLDNNIVKFYKNRIKTNDRDLEDMRQQIAKLKSQTKARG